MDTRIENPYRSFRGRLAVGAGVFLLLMGFGYLLTSAYFRPATLNVEAAKLNVSTVSKASFFEFINLDGRIAPVTTYLIDSKISGNVDRLFVTSGQVVEAGDTLLYVANADLELEVMQRESQLIEQLNAQRQTRLLLNQNDFTRREQLVEINYQLALQEKRYRRDKSLLADSLIALRDFEPSENNFRYYQSRQRLLRESFKVDSLARRGQLAQIDAFESRILQNLGQVRSILDRLYLRAAVGGRLGDFTVRTGQSVTSGQRLGEIYSLEDPLVVAEVDEFYLGKITVGQLGIITGRSDSVRLSVTKIYPTVNAGRFRVEARLQSGDDSNEFIKGQSVRFRLLFGEEDQSVLLANGEFYGSSGGNWVYRLVGRKAERTPVKLGRSNPNYFEVLEGLSPGDRVITSAYDDFENYQSININQP